jgi:hypothetical protein
MDKNKLNYLIDLGLVISFILVFITGVIKFPELIRYLGLRHRDIPMYEITLIHDWSGIFMGILVFIHLLLHWKWIVVTTRSFLKRR